MSDNTAIEWTDATWNPVMHPAGMAAMVKSNPFNPFERGHPDWTTRIERVGKRAAGRLLDGRTCREATMALGDPFLIVKTKG